MKRISTRRGRRARYGLVQVGAVMAAVVLLMGGVAFAVLQSQQLLLTGNTMSTATARPQISTNNSTFTSVLPGFDFSGIIPGGDPVPEVGQRFYLKNTGQAPMSIKMAVSTEPTNPNNVNLDKVKVILLPIGGGTPQAMTLQSMIDAAPNGGGIVINAPQPLASGVTATYALQVQMDEDAMSNDGATLGNIDFIFTGYAATN